MRLWNKISLIILLTLSAQLSVFGSYEKDFTPDVQNLKSELIPSNTVALVWTDELNANGCRGPANLGLKLL